MPDNSIAGGRRERIAIVSHAHPSISKGGAEGAAYGLYLGLRTIGADAIFIAACQRTDVGRLRLGSDREFVVTTEPDQYEHFYHLAAPSVTRQLLELLRREQITLINFHHFLNFGMNALHHLALLHMKPGLALYRPQIVLTLHEFLLICNHHGQMVTRPAQTLCSSATAHKCATCFPDHTPQQFERRRALFLQAIGNLAAYVAPSRFLAGRMVHWGLPANNIAVIENGVEGAGIGHRVRKPRIPGAPFVFGYFGQITPFKGVSTLLDAADFFAKQRSFQNDIEIRIHGNMVGQGQDFLDRCKAVFERHSFVTYTGPYENTDVNALMSACDYVLVPSVWWENSPLVIQEAFLSGCPVICSGIGGMAEKVEDGVSGLHFRVGSGADLARVMRIAADPSLHDKLAAGLPKVDDHVAAAQRYLSLFRSLPPAGLSDRENVDALGGNDH